VEGDDGDEALPPTHVETVGGEEVGKEEWMCCLNLSKLYKFPHVLFLHPRSACDFLSY
jgi:hypothetical protein